MGGREGVGRGEGGGKEGIEKEWGGSGEGEGVGGWRGLRRGMEEGGK